MWKEFRAFLIKDNVIGLAIAVILGTALNKLVGSIVDDLIMPVISLVTPSGNWQAWALALRTDLQGNPTAQLKIGNFLAATLNFLVIGLVLWQMSKAFIRPAKKEA